VRKIGTALARAFLHSHIKQRLLLYGAHSKIAHTYCLIALSLDAMKAVDSLLEILSRKMWGLPTSFPRIGLLGPIEEIGLNIPSIWEDFCGSAFQSCTQNLNDEGALGTTARASLHGAASKFCQWPLELAFHSRKSGSPLCPSIVARYMASKVMLGCKQ